MLSRISVSHKLLLIYVLDMITVVFLGWILAEEKYISINFARKELVGQAYFTAARDTLFGVIDLDRQRRAGAPVQAARGLDGAAGRLAKAESELGADLDSAAQAERALATVRRMAAGEVPAEPAVADLRALIARVGDTSNLILDRDLDSYYTMSVVTLRLPELVQTVLLIDAQMRQTAVHRDELLVLEGRLDSAAAGLMDDLAAGIRGNPDGTLAPAVQRRYADIDQALTRLRADIRRAVTGSLGPGEAAAFGGQVAAILDATRTTWDVTARELDALLQARIDGLLHRMTMHFTLAGGILAVILTLVLLVARRIAKPIAHLADIAGRVHHGNDYTLRAQWRSGDEIGRLVVAFNTMLERLQTEKQREQEAAARARAAEAQRQLIEAIPTPLVVLRMDDLGILHANRPATELLAADWLSDVERRRLALCRDDRVEEFEAQVAGADGSRLWALMSARVLTFQNERAVLITVVPITEHRRMEEELRGAKDRAESTLADLRQAQHSLIQAEKLASLGGLVAGVAHEINTPVGIGLTAASVLAGRTEAVRRLYAADDMGQADFEDFLTVAGDSARLLLTNMERAASLIQSFKQVAVDQVSAERRRFALAAYIEEVLTSLHPTLRKTRIAVDLACPPRLELDSFPGALSQVLTNLVINAVTHAFEDGAQGRITITVDQPVDENVRLVFADDGKGIADDHMGRIFDPFFTTRRSAGGSGLGLHIVYNIVTGTLAGRIEAASEPGRGTAFTLTFPRTTLAAAAQ